MRFLARRDFGAHAISLGAHIFSSRPASELYFGGPRLLAGPNANFPGWGPTRFFGAHDFKHISIKPTRFPWGPTRPSRKPTYSAHADFGAHFPSGAHAISLGRRDFSPRDFSPRAFNTRFRGPRISSRGRLRGPRGTAPRLGRRLLRQPTQPTRFRGLIASGLIAIGAHVISLRTHFKLRFSLAYEMHFGPTRPPK